MFKKKIITGCESRGDGQTPYLTRWTLLTTRRGSLYLHVFHRSDHDVLHDHPWPFVSLILWRGYYETYRNYSRDRDGCRRGTFGRRRIWPGMLLFRPATWRHRVELVNGKPAVTLVWVGKKVREWGFWEGFVFTPWKQYFDHFGCWGKKEEDVQDPD